MNESHTKNLLEEAFSKVQEYNYLSYINLVKTYKRSFRDDYYQKHIANRVLEKFGLHLMYKSTLDDLESQSYARMGKWSSVGMLLLALKNPDEFDEVYNLFLDEDSRVTFDWFIKYRVAYAFLGELASEIFPPKISRAEYLSKISDIKVNNGLIDVHGYQIRTGALEAAQAFLFEQYSLEGKCKVDIGDHVINGGAFEGETSFWFISKGADKVYAFEPDQFNYSILVENIERNRVSNRILPIKKILSNKIGTFSFCSAGVMSVVINEGKQTIQGITLDSFVEDKGLNRVDFLKLDVEGAELEILEGAVETIKKFKPKMAISVYHKPDDIVSIPKFILQLLPKAKFYLSHKFYTLAETVLFVNPRDN